MRIFQLFLALLVVVSSACSSRHEVASNTYYGELKNEDVVYKVEIYETTYSDSSSLRVVHLNPKGESDESWITGHDYNNDGEWDAIFYCGKHKMVDPNNSGCNSVIKRARGGVWDFVPCKADEGRVKPFGWAAIAFAVNELDRAMARVRNQDNLARQWRWNVELDKGEYVYRRS